MKMCPRKFNENTVDASGVHGECVCEEDECAWWNAHFGMCCEAVDAYLIGVGEGEILSCLKHPPGGEG